MRVLVQEHLAPGDTLGAQWEVIEAAGLHGIELHGRDEAFPARLPELRAARAAGVPMPTVCLISETFIGDFDPARRRRAVGNMKGLLSAIAEIGGTGAVTPAAFGLASTALPPFSVPRTPAEDREVLLEGLGELAEHAGREGVLVYLEPLNRYEDHMLHRLDDALGLIDALGSPHVKVMADLFHMSIEEDDLPAALRACGSRLGHVHLADSQRSHPGTGHTDFTAIVSALGEMGYDGSLALECGLRGDRARALAQVATLLAGQT